VVGPQSCRVIYYFDTPTLGRRHQLFGRVIWHESHNEKMICSLLLLQRAFLEIAEFTSRFEKFGRLPQGHKDCND